MNYALQFADIADYYPLLVDGIIVTIILAASAMAGGFVIGSAMALAQLSQSRFLRATAKSYVEFTRNTPLLVQMLFCFFALPSLGLRLSPLEAALVALVWNNGAYTTEIIRAGLQSIPRGQIEAAQSLGMGRYQLFRHVVFVPALANVYPALVSQFNVILLNSSITSAIGVEDLTGAGGYIQSETFRAFEVYIVVTILYVVLSLLFRGTLFAIGPMRFTRARLMRNLRNRVGGACSPGLPKAASQS